MTSSNFTLEDTLGYRLNRATILLRLELRSRFAQLGHNIAAEEWAILNRLWEQDGQSQNELARLTIKDKTTISRLLANMERKNLIRREAGKKDSRVKEIYLSPTGKKLKGQLIPVAVALLKECTTAISDQDLKLSMRTLQQIEKNLLAMSNE